MMTTLAKRAARAMDRRYGYDASYLPEVATVSAGGALRLSVFLPLLSGYRAGAPVDLWAGAVIASTRDGDCGPCLQLVIDMALEQGANPAALRDALEGRLHEAGITGLGYRFGLAAISGAEDLPSLRQRIRDEFSEQALVSLSITAATGRAWPVVKRGLGHGMACTAVSIDHQRLSL